MVKQKAFTVNELLIIVFIVLIFTIFDAIFVIHNKEKLNKDFSTLQYGCWSYEDELYEWYFYNLTPKTLYPQKVDKCVFKPLKKEQNLYVVATGAGGNNISGHLMTSYFPYKDKNLNINIGKYSKDGKPTDTVLISNNENILTAKSINTNNEFDLLLSGNVKSCKIVNDYSSNKCAKTCEVVDFLDIDNQSKRMIKINGCENNNNDSINVDNYIDFKNVIVKNPYNSQIDFNNISNENIKLYSLPNNFIFQGVDNSKEKRKFDFNLDFYDSDLFNTRAFLGHKDNQLNTYNSIEKSKMSSILELIPIDNKTSLVSKLISGNFGAPKTNGAVFIIW